MSARGLTAPEQVAIESQQLRIAHLLEIHFSTVDRATTWGSALAWGGNTYLATGGLLSLPDIEESMDIRSGAVSIVLSGVNQSSIATALTENFIDRRVVIMRGFLDTANNWSVNPRIIFDGRIDSWRIAEDVDEGYSTVTWSVSSHWVDFERSSGRTTNYQEAKINSPGDDFFKFSAEISEITWGLV